MLNETSIIYTLECNHHQGIIISLGTYILYKGIEIKIPQDQFNLLKLMFTFWFRFLFNPKYYYLEGSDGSTINVVAILLGDYGRSLPDLHCKRIDANITINYISLYRTEQILARLDAYCLANDSPVCLISGSVSNHHPLFPMQYWLHIEWTRCIEYTSTFFRIIYMQG